MAASALQAAVKKIAQREGLSSSEAADAFTEVMRGEATPALIAAFLVGLRVKGESVAEVAGVARAVRDAMTVVDADQPEGLVDTCGTGGGTLTTFNISTVAALVAAGAGVRVAKHGNRSFTSKSGSADVLEALGVRIDIAPDRMRGVLESAGIVFMFAPTMHPAFRHVGPVRKELGIPTVMNIVGPLANPARAGRQVIGVAERARQELIAGAMSELGSVRTLVVHGEPGMDEISPLGATEVIEINGGKQQRWTLNPADLGVKGVSASELAGDTPAENARLAERILAGKGSAGAEAAVALNAAAAIYVSGAAGDFPSAFGLAKNAIVSGAGLAALERLRKATAG